MWWLATLNRIEKPVWENAFDEMKKSLGLNFDPQLALIILAFKQLDPKVCLKIK